MQCSEILSIFTNISNFTSIAFVISNRHLKTMCVSTPGRCYHFLLVYRITDILYCTYNIVSNKALALESFASSYNRERVTLNVSDVTVYLRFVTGENVKQ